MSRTARSGAGGRRSPVAARCGPWPRLSQGNASEGHGAGGGDYVARDGESGVASFGSRHGPARGRLPVGLEGQVRRTEDGHQTDGGVAGLMVAAVTGPTTGLHGQVVLAPLSFPMGQGAAGHAKAIGSLMVRQPVVASPTVESHRTATGRTICFTPIALSRPASFQRFLGDGTHRFRGCCYRAFLLWRRFLDRGRCGSFFFLAQRPACSRRGASRPVRDGSRPPEARLAVAGSLLPARPHAGLPAKGHEMAVPWDAAPDGRGAVWSTSERTR